MEFWNLFRIINKSDSLKLNLLMVRVISLQGKVNKLHVPRISDDMTALFVYSFYIQFLEKNELTVSHAHTLLRLRIPCWWSHLTKATGWN